MWAAPASFEAHARGDQRVVSVPKGVRSADTQAALTGARTTPSVGADGHGRRVALQYRFTELYFEVVMWIVVVACGGLCDLC